MIMDQNLHTRSAWPHNDFIKFDGHFLYVEVEDYRPDMLIDAISMVANYCQATGIRLVERDAYTRDNPNGSCTIRYKIEAM